MLTSFFSNSCLLYAYIIAMYAKSQYIFAIFIDLLSNGCYNAFIAFTVLKIYMDYKGERISIVEPSKINGSIERRDTLTINERIRFIRKDLDMSQVMFAESLGVGQTTVSYMEKKHSTVKEQHLKLICKMHNVNYFWLTEGKGDPYLGVPSILMNDVIQKYGLDDMDRTLIEEYVKMNSEARSIIKQLLINVVKNAPE